MSTETKRGLFQGKSSLGSHSVIKNTASYSRFKSCSFHGLTNWINWNFYIQCCLKCITCFIIGYNTHFTVLPIINRMFISTSVPMIGAKSWYKMSRWSWRCVALTPSPNATCAHTDTLSPKPDCHNHSIFYDTLMATSSPFWWERGSSGSGEWRRRPASTKIGN